MDSRRIANGSRAWACHGRTGLLASLFLLCLLLTGCSKAEHPNALAGDGSDSAHPFNPTLGNPCAVEGEVRACGHVTKAFGNYVTCSMGEATCQGGMWGACVGDHLTTMSLPNVQLDRTGLHVSSVPVACTNVCDPYCQSTQGEPKDVDAGSIIPDPDGGVTLEKADGGVTVKASNNCRDLQCKLVTCTGAGVTTTISGTVYDPAGNNPMYNANVYIPVKSKEALPPFGSGASCDTCAGAAALVALRSTQTDSNGNFTLSDVPAGANIPVVVQMGKWRREIVLTSVASCTSNSVTNNCTAPNPADCAFRLPRSHTDGYDPVAATYTKADVPKIAIVSGSADPFDCLLLKAGLDPAEFGDSSSNKRFHFYHSDNNPGNKLSSTYGAAVAGSTLTNNLSQMMSYDVLLLPCEGGNYDKQTTGNTPYQNLIKYADSGGRAFATHFSYTWLQYPSVKGYAPASNDWSKVAKWTHSSGSTNTQDPLPALVDTSFPKGAVYSTWLQNVAATSSPGKLTVHEGRQDLTTVGSDTQSWMSAIDTKYPAAPNYSPLFTFNTPYGAPPANQCGRVVYSDFHVSANALVAANQCLSDADCGYTASCTGSTANGAVGQCSEPCDTTADCPSTTYACSGAVVGKCKVKGCTANTDCPSGETCNAGACTCSAAAAAAECISGTCNSMTCKAAHACTSNANCGLGTCGGGTCTKSGTNGAGACRKNSDCGLGTCGGGANNGTCAAGAACHVDANCGVAGTCGSGTGATAGACATNATSCHSGASCDSGACAGGTCGTAGTVCHVDANCDGGATCGSGTGSTAGTCSTNAAACHSNAACDSGSCTGGTCATTTSTVCHKNADCDSGICGATKGTCSRTCASGIKQGLPCTSNAACGSGITCGAASACSIDTDCTTAGSVCNNVKCSAKACGDDATCGVSKLCNSAKCTTAAACAGDNGCAVSKLCNNAKCASASCTGDSSCGVSGLCNNAKCTATTCAGDNACSVSKLCNNAKCNASTCANDGECASGSACNNAKCTMTGVVCGSKADCGTSSSNACSSATCSLNACSTNADCGSGGTCGGGSCDTGDDCVNAAGCGTDETCNGFAQGSCGKSCLRNSDCAPDLCVGGKCGGCTNSAQCNDNAYPASCAGIPAGKYGKCSVYTAGQFPAACRQGALSPQEKALEFMFFDLTACLSPDDLPPADPTVLSGYNPATFIQDYTADCADGTKPIWREFDWQASIPETASIVITAQSGDTVATLAPAMPLTIATATTDTNVGTDTTHFDYALIDTGKGSTPSGPFNQSSPPIPSRNLLRLSITLNPTGDALDAPTLVKWKVQYDCAPAE